MSFNNFKLQVKDLLKFNFDKSSYSIAENVTVLKEFDLIHTILNNSPSVIYIFSYTSMTYEYFSPNLEKTFGYKASNLLGVSGADFVFNLIHPDHVAVALDFNNIIMKYYSDYIPLGKVQQTRASYTLKIKKASGEYVWALLQQTVLNVNDEGLPEAVLFFVTDLSDIKKDTICNFVFSFNQDPDSNQGFETIYAENRDLDKITYILSRREIEVLNLINKGLKNPEIAAKLSINIETVKSHRKNILKKSGRNNFIQMLY